uniref:Uncharacterized protein n=1 Tax=Arundo donax TaxID=35708 RepID=A0A0A9B2S8_ARUDO
MRSGPNSGVGANSPRSMILRSTQIAVPSRSASRAHRCRM